MPNTIEDHIREHARKRRRSEINSSTAEFRKRLQVSPAISVSAKTITDKCHAFARNGEQHYYVHDVLDQLEDAVIEHSREYDEETAIAQFFYKVHNNLNGDGTD